MINVIFVCLLSCCSWFMPLKDNLSCEKQDQIQEVEKINRKSLYSQSGYTLFEITSVFNSEFLYQLNQTLFYNQYHYDFTEYAFQNNSTYVRLIEWKDVDVYANDLGFSNGVNISTFKFEFSTEGSQGNCYAYDYNFTIAGGNALYTGGVACNRFDTTSYTQPYGANMTLFNRNGGSYYFIMDNSYSYLFDILVNTDSFVYQIGYEDGTEYGYNLGRQKGYSEGVEYGQAQSGTAVTIFTGILEVGLLPVNVFLKMFEYEVFGINIAGLISGLLTISMIMILIRFIFGGKEK